MDAYLTLVSKRDLKEYADEPIPEEAVYRILDAGRLAGSAGNRQPWQFVVIERSELVEQVAETVYVPANVLGAALVVVVLAPGRGGTTLIDVGRAVQNIMLAAWSEGVASSPNGMPDADRTAAVLGAEGDLRPVLVLSLGYPARAVDAEVRSPEEWSRRARRKPFDEVVRRL